MKRTTPPQDRDYEKLGFDTMKNTRDEAVTKAICALHLSALESRLRPALNNISAKVHDIQYRLNALGAQLYNRRKPVNDLEMLALSVAVVLSLIVLSVALVMSGMANVATFLLFGWTLLFSIGLGLAVTVAAAVAGQQAFEYLQVHRWSKMVVAFIALAFCFWGIWIIGGARTAMASLDTQKAADESFVDDLEAENLQSGGPADQSAQERQIRRSMSDGIFYVAFSLDVLVGMLFGLVWSICTMPDFTGWRTARRLKREFAALNHQRDQLAARLDIARCQCLAGVLAARSEDDSRHPPYIATVTLAIVLQLWGAGQVGAQTDTIEWQLLDSSGSVAGSAGTSKGSFGGYVAASRELLRSQPAGSRVLIGVITTDSFGGVPVLLKGRTPHVKGVLTSELQRAREQLVREFERRSSGLSPVAGGTDLIGALWRIKTVTEAEQNSSTAAKIGRVFSDGIHETTAFNMRALVSSGAQNMLSIAKANGLIVPLNGHRIYFSGAATTGLSPAAWNTIKAFWTLYFRLAGADLRVYSSETISDRSIK